jgi:DNA mismatch repair protein MutS
MRRANPRDLAAIRDGLALVPNLKQLMLKTLEKNNLEEISYFKNLDIELASENEIFEELKRALLPDLPLTAREGGVIASGYSAQLDEFKNLSNGGAKMMADLQAKYMQKTGVNLLRIKYNNIIGYFIEVPPKSAQALLEDTFFIHRQTMVSGIRFTTSELKELEGQVISAQSRALNLELEIFNNLCEKINSKASEIYKLAQMVAKIDVASALALVAQTYNYVRPIVDGSTAFEIRAGRHPVVEQALKKEGAKAFITNDCKLDENDEVNSKLWLITGPNMAGKSTFLRGNALIAIMAHIGSFVPADYAHIGVIDKLFSRVGSGDDLAQGRSTFMVEMQELACILNNASERSFIILDEIGRGTSTYDGMSLAWSSIEYLHNVNKSRVLVSTHYHELTELANKLNQLSLHTMQVQEYGSEVVFLHKIGAGAADRSYGIHVARLAGLPSAVNARAQEILDLLETSAKSGKMAKLSENLSLFDFSKPEVRKPDYTELVALLKSIQPDDLSPKEALSALYELKKSLK